MSRITEFDACDVAGRVNEIDGRFDGDIARRILVMFVAYGDGEAADGQRSGLMRGTQFHRGLQQRPRLGTSVANFGKPSDFLKQFQQLKLLRHM